MATAADLNSASVEISAAEDPLLATPSQPHLRRHRYASYDDDLFTLYSDGSPAQAKRALQAHLAETERRLQEASQLGTSLVTQREELSKRLKDVEKQQDDDEIGPELRQKLRDLEREFHEVGKETARVFIPKGHMSRVSNVDSAEPRSVYEREAQHSPSKVHAPSRKQRNQAPSRINDIKLATDISTSLLSQIRDLQAILAEKDDALKAAQHDRSQIEIDCENLGQRIRAMDESEQRYKDENWNLETQIHEMLANQKGATEREQRLLQQLSLTKAEKTTMEKDFEDLKSSHGKLSDDHAASRKSAETQLQELRKNVSIAESERSAMQKKIDDLQGQNQELAKAISYRNHSGQHAPIADVQTDSDDDQKTHTTPEHSPPPSPSKATPRHGHLETETLKSSLHHAHRMIQNLKNNIHREKTEKIELKRMLQETREEIKNSRAEHGPQSAGKKRKTAVDKDLFKKPPRPDRLGAARSTDIVMDDEWEDQDDHDMTLGRREARTAAGISRWVVPSSSIDPPQDTTEASDAFDTANERDTSTETEAFQTGVETLDGNSSDELTETENNYTDASRSRSAKVFNQLQRSESYNSTASTSASEDEPRWQTPTQSNSQSQQRHRLKMNRSRYNRRSTEPEANTPTAFKNSPSHSSLINNSNDSTPAAGGRNLAAELASFSDGEGSEAGSFAEHTPIRSRTVSRETSPEVRRAGAISRNDGVLTTSHPLHSVPASSGSLNIVNSGIMTEPWSPALGGLENASLANNSVPKSVRPDFSASGYGTNVEHEHQHAIARANCRALALGFSTVISQHFEPDDSLHMPDLKTGDIVPQFRGEAAFLQKSMPHKLTFVPIQKQETEPLKDSQSSDALTATRANELETLRDDLEAQESKHQELVSGMQREINERGALASSRSSALVALQFQFETQRTQHERDLIMLRDEIKEHKTVATTRASQIKLLTSQLESERFQSAEAMKGLKGELDEHEAATAASALCLAEMERSHRHMENQVSEMRKLQQDAEQELLSRRRLGASALIYQHVEPIYAPKSQPSIESLTISNINASHISPESSATGYLHSPNVFSPLQTPLRTSGQKDGDDNSRQWPDSPTLPEPGNTLDHSLATLHRPPILNYSSIAVQELYPLNRDIDMTKLSLFRTANAISNALLLRPQNMFNQEALTSNLKNAPTDRGTENEFDDVAASKSAQASTKEHREPFKPVTGNARERSPSPEKAMGIKFRRVKSVDEATQTNMSSGDIDVLLLTKERPVSIIAPLPGIGSELGPSFNTPASPTRSWRSSKEFGADSNGPMSPRRPSSSGSIRNRAATPPPLPADHRRAIQAASKSQNVPPTPPLPAGPPPTNVESMSAPPGSMGPPPLPMTTHRRSVSRTRPPLSVPSSPNPKSGMNQRPRHGTARSQSLHSVTRRSSVSSFASELDQRFNISSNGGPGVFDPNTTDPRMIQAITQTMIGEYLWKYTRKAGRGEMSENRHRRFFWVHPYTRTLYWSDQDPATAGRAQMKAKSVAIEAVRVVTDDNPMPPGLHRKSLIVVTPGRSIKFTATTGQRHETWFNALSYLLLRAADERDDDNVNITAEDVNEFNPKPIHGGVASRMTERSRVSLSSYNSRTTRQSSPHRAHHEIPTLTPRRSTASVQAQLAPSSPFKSPGTITRNTIGRVSSIFRPSVRGSVASSRSRQNISHHTLSESDIYQASVVNDSAEELRRVLEAQDRGADRLENVRACCDGKHDVGSLARNSRNGSHSGRTSQSVNLHGGRISQT